MSTLDDETAAFIRGQRVFFVATAPLAADGHVNLSPKGLDTFAVLDESAVAYLDLTGSGAETAAHVRENGRIAVLFCAFEGPPRIVRIHGRGEAIEPSHPGFAALAARLPKRDGVRAIVRVAVTRVATSCGHGVPLMPYAGERTQIPDWCERLGAGGLAEYRARKNRRSLDGLPALDG